MKVVVVGYGAAGMTAASYAALTNRKAEIIAFEKRSYAVYHPCSLPDLISGIVKSPEHLKEPPPRLPRLKVYTSTVVKEIKRGEKKVVVQDLKSGKEWEEDYDKLILATGSFPYVPRVIKILNSDGVHVLKKVEDAEAILDLANKYKRAVVVGGSFIGIETAHALKKKGLKVTLIEYFPQVMPGKLNEQLARVVEKALEDEGIVLKLGVGVKEISGEVGNKKIIAGDEEISGDFVVMATGTRPDVELAKKAGLEIGESGGIKVNEKMQTSDPSIYAAGDNAEVINIVTGQPMLSLLGSTAVKMGRVAGINAAGGKAKFRGVVNVWIVNIESLRFGGAGITFDQAKKLGLNAVAVTVQVPEKLEIYPDAHEMTIRLIADKDSGRILGGQILGKEGVLCRLDVLATVLSRGMTAEELAELELAYTPSVCEIIDPLHVAADALLKRLRRYKTI
ncbi:MAG: NADH oxidase [Thermoprotei archaeon]|nr:MAG: NADH oxidase [Thermoprotei archaeon]